MGLNRGYDRPMIVIGGNVKTSGGSLNLAKGQLALIDRSQTTVNGAAVVTTTAGKPKKAKDFVIRCGITDNTPDRSHSNKNASTMPFSLDQIRDLRVSAPEQTERSVDEVIIGYNGIDPSTAFTFKVGDPYFRFSLELEGAYIEWRGSKGITEMVNVNVEVPNCDPFENCVECDECAGVDCKAIVMEVIERLKRKQLSGGMLVSEVVDITPILSCDNPSTATEIPYTFYTLEVCDTGTDEALALVAAQYDVPVVRIDRVGSTSTYQMLLPNPTTPADYDQTLASIIKGCEDCPAGWTATDSGVLYAFSIEDDGTDQSALITALPGYVAGSIVATPGTNDGVGYYTAVINDKLTQAEITAFLGGGAPANTATIDYLGEINALCTNATVTSTAWVAGDSCNAIQERWTIVLPDNECGQDRLAELNSNYTQGTVTVSYTAASSAITLTGTSGTATITIDGTNYTVTFNTSLTQTADDFVTAEAGNILTNHGYAVTANAGVITIAGTTDVFNAPTIANATGDLDGTIVTTFTQDAGGCQRRYEMWVTSNLVCGECDPIYEDYWVTEAPESYDTHTWELADNTASSPNGNCLCGIRIKGKTFDLEGELALRDQVGFVETSTKVRVSAGYPEEIREGIGTIPEGAFEGTYLSRWIPRTHLGGNLTDLECEGRHYFNGATKKDHLGRVLRGELSNIEDETKQYVHYTLEVEHSNMTQGFGGRVNDTINYDIFVEVGRHTAVENLLNDIATHAGVSPVQAFGA